MESANGWDIHTGNPSVAVGICDTGIRTTHQDLLLHRLEGYNAVDRKWESQGGNIDPVHPHGTNTTGCAAANGNNGVGVAGVGWNLSHRMLRVSNDPSGGAYLSDLQHAARTSIEAGDRVANVSYSGVDTNSNLTTATYIKSIGGLLVWSAGNDGRNLTFGNRDNDDLLVIGATNQNDTKASFSAYGIFVDLVAPGVDVLTTHSSNNSSYAYVSGTSFSAPLTTGLCALISSADPSLTPDDIEDFLKQGTDDLGSSGVDNTYGYGRINVFGSLSLIGGGNPPVADFSGTPTSGVAPLTVNFTDLSINTPTSWSWDFGDNGTSNQQNPTHTYNEEGTYTVTLTATNPYGSDTEIKVNYIAVSPGPPVADFSGSPTSGNAPLTVNFTDLSAGSPTSWSWDFGDNGTSTAQNPTHVYDDPGDYTVTLTVTNAQGSDTEVKVNYISVSDPPPVAEFVGNPTSGTAPLTVNFTDLSTNNPTSWTWGFGDNSSSNLQNPTHVYENPGLYTVYLIATNASGTDWEIKTDYIHVTEDGDPPVADFSGSPTSGNAPLTVNFTDLSSNSPTSWSWNFGDNGTSNVKNPTHVYTNPGDYTVTLTATNAFGSDTEVKVNYISVFANPPVLYDVVPDEGPVAGFTAVTITGSNFTSTFDTTVTFDGVEATSVNVLNYGTITCDTPANPAGPADLTVANSNGSETLFGAFFYHNPPSISSVMPDNGPMAGSTPVTISGGDFTSTGDTTVTFGGTFAVDMTVVNASTITCKTPPSAASGPVDVFVSNSWGSDTLTNGFSYNPPPEITGISPSVGLFQGGTTVTVSGNYFLPSQDTEVFFGGEPAVNVVVVDANNITCDTPEYPIPDLVDVEVINSNGSDLLEKGFEFIPQSGAAPLNLTHIDTLNLFPGDIVRHAVTGQPGALYMVFLSLGGGPLNTPWGVMGLDVPFYHAFSFNLNAQGYHVVPLQLEDMGGYFEFYTHAIVDDKPPVWAVGGNNPNGSGSIKWGLN
jgi:PKD repeat protein